VLHKKNTCKLPFSVAALGKNFDAAPAPVPVPSLLRSQPTFLKSTNDNSFGIGAVGVRAASCYGSAKMMRLRLRNTASFTDGMHVHCTVYRF
jgi:hypothetical protein